MLAGRERKMADHTPVGRFKPVSNKVRFPALEEEVLRFWKERDIFRRSVDEREGSPRFVMFEGPPTANGSPGIHHVLSRVFKDIFPRYKTMQGFQAPRKGGWDTHGLPVELEVEKELGIKSKLEIEAFGVEEFNQRCRESVFRYVKEWEAMTERVAFWVDLENAYVTYRNDYIETGWWIIKTLWDHDLVYEGRRVAPHCPRCGTTLSSHEVSLGYKDNTSDPSVYVKFAVIPDTVPDALKPHVDDRTYFLAWTTTPWTLPGNSALSVSSRDEYVLVRLSESGESLILAAACLDRSIREDYEVVARVPGSELEGAQYRPLYDPVEYGIDVLRFDEPGSPLLVEVELDSSAVTYPVILADFVSMDEGAGIVHTSPPFGEDDYQAGIANALRFIQPVNLAGEFTGTYKWAGKFVKNADPVIMDELKARGLLYRRETIKHTYPFCWRCETPLLYYAKSSWYLKTTAVKDRLLAANDEIDWHPGHYKNGRFGDWLRGNVDWAISRERYWGTPWPIWRCEGCRHHEALGSVAELREKPGSQGVTEDLDLHRPYVDRITFDCPSCGATMRRVPEVMDGWFDSGAMPFAQWHYPHENRDIIESGAWYPADFISEAVDQTRGWFYSLHAVASLLEKATEGLIQAPSFRTVVSLGHILDGKGEKMSKSKGNVVEPWEVINAHGADAVRWYLFSATPPGNSRRFSNQLVEEAVRSFLLTLWNTYSFFVTYANIDGFDPSTTPELRSENELDRWVLSRLHTLIGEVTESMDGYDPTTASRRIQAFVDDLSNWYVRRSRRRFWKSENDVDKTSAYTTLYECLVTLTELLAPFTPFVAEEMYRNLVLSVDAQAPESVHLTTFPKPDAAKLDSVLAGATDLVIRAVSLGRAARSKAKLRVRQPLAKLVVATASAGDRSALERLSPHILEELNVKAVDFVAEASELVDYRVKGNPAELGPKHGQNMGKVMAEIAGADAQALTAQIRSREPIEVGGFVLEPSDLQVELVDKDGYAAANEGGLTVAVTTEVTPDLALEGLARELVHRIQTMRRSAGFDIADRIVTHFQTGSATARVFEVHGAYIRQETLSERLVDGPAPEGAHIDAGKLDGADLTLGVTRA
jgi:isoleucyl-tRNA synthetase